MEEIKRNFMITNSASIMGLSELSNSIKQKPLDVVRILLSYPYCDFVNQVFKRTREYEAGLYFADFCYAVIGENVGIISEKEFFAWDKMLINLKLNMFDYLNYWNDYVSLYDYVLQSKEYTYTVGQPLEPEKTFGEHLKGYDNNGNCLVDFSYVFQKRYELIKYKQQKLLNGELIGNMLRHQKEMLSYEERVNRYNVLLQTFKKFKAKG